MKKKILSGMLLRLLLISILLLTFGVKLAESSEPPPTEWTRTYGGTNYDEAFSMVQTIDGGYAMAGYTKSFGAGHNDFWLISTDLAGNMEWNKTFGGWNEDYGWAVVQTVDGGYAIAGYTNSFGAGYNDFWLVKTDSIGKMVWNRTYGGVLEDVAYSVVQTSEGGYALAGYTTSFGAASIDYCLIRTDSAGNVLWSKTYGGTNHDYGRAVVQTVDGGYAIAGYTNSFGAGGFDFWLVKTDVDGNMEWNKTYGGTSEDWGRCLVQTKDEGYALAGYTASSGIGAYDFWLVKTDVDGNMEWNKTYGGTSEDWAYSVIETYDGGYAIAGRTMSFGGSWEMWLIKTDAVGNVQWNSTYGGALPESANSVVETSDGGYAIAGLVESFGSGTGDFWLIKLAPEEIPATIDIDPDTLNLKSNGEWMTAYIEPPESYNIEDIDISTVMLNNTISVDPDAPTQIEDYDLDSVPDLMVKFDRTSIIEWLGTMDYSENTGKSYSVTFSITGKVLDTVFEGSDTIKMLRK